MAEAMAIETLTERWLASSIGASTSYARYPLCGPNGGYTDVDALALSRGQGILAVAECKARGGAHHIDQVATSVKGGVPNYYRSAVGTALAVTAANNAWLLDALETDFQRVTTIRVALVANIVRTGPMDAVDAAFTLELQHDLTAALTTHGLHVEGLVRTPVEVLAERFKQIRSLTLDWGRRLGHPQDDLLRELARYADGPPAARQHLAEVLTSLSSP